MRITLVILAVILALPGLAQAALLDSSQAEKLYRSGDYPGARAEFERLIDEFASQTKDSDDYRAYRELAYYYDRLADCCFTQRDWPALKENTDGLAGVVYAERSMVESQLAGALESGVAFATARYLYDRVDEAVRLSSLVELKRTISLLLLDTGGAGASGEQAIKQYQALAAVVVNVVEVDHGFLTLNISRLEASMDKFKAIFAEVEKVCDPEALWKKYLPGEQAPAASPEAGQ